MLYLAYTLSALAIVAMAVDLVLAVRLKRQMAGGEVSRKWTLLTVLLGIFFVGYVLSPLLLLFQLDVQYMSLLVFGVFLFGAVFVWIVIGILRDTLSFLDLLSS